MSRQERLLKKIGMTDLAESLFSKPKEFRDYRDPIYVLPLPDTGHKHLMSLVLTDIVKCDGLGVVTESDSACRKIIATLADSRGDAVECWIYGGFYEWNILNVGEEIFLYGELVRFGRKRSLKSVEIVPTSLVGTVQPTYSGITGKLKSVDMRSLVRDAVSNDLFHQAGEILLSRSKLSAMDFTRLYGYDSTSTFFRHLHEPDSIYDGERAARVASDVSHLAIVLNADTRAILVKNDASCIKIDKDAIALLIRRIPYTLTDDQARCVDEITDDLSSGFPMRRLLSGDVGTGKTLAFLVPAIAAHLAGAKVAIMVPNELLVPQIAAIVRSIYPEVPVSEVYAGNEYSGGLIIGTTAILHFVRKSQYRLDFVIIDEQQRFSVDQRKALLQSHTNLLESTATAIPRTLALVRLGGGAISILSQCPVEKKIVTRIVRKKDGDRLFSFFDKQLAAGARCAVVYPYAEQVDQRNSVESAFHRFHSKFGDAVGMLHGSMSPGEKISIIEKVKSGNISLLVSSTVIEVGVDIPNLNCMAVVSPHHFGSAQLHQLRGRLARHGGVGYFFLYLPDDVDEMVLSRLRLLVECTDGFTLAERDADLRGMGEIHASGNAQSGKTKTLFFGVSLDKACLNEKARSLGMT